MISENVNLFLEGLIQAYDHWTTDPTFAWTTKQNGWLSPSSSTDGVHLRMNCPASVVRFVLCGPLNSSSEILSKQKRRKKRHSRLNTLLQPPHPQMVFHDSVIEILPQLERNLLFSHLAYSNFLSIMFPSWQLLYDFLGTDESAECIYAFESRQTSISTRHAPVSQIHNRSFVHEGHGISRCCIMGNWTCIRFLKTFHLSRLLRL